MLEGDECHDMDVDSDNPEEISPLKSHVRECLRKFQTLITRTKKLILFGCLEVLQEINKD